MARQKLRIILIAGCPRSGTTILDNILGQSAGFFSGGELRDLWHVAQASDRLCVCGSRLRDCEIWKGVFGRLYGDVSLSRVLAERSRDPLRHLRLKDLWRLTTASGRKRFQLLTTEHAREAQELYHAVSAQTGAHTIVDSTKLPAGTYLITQIPSLDVYVVHLVRDARAVVFSRLRKKPDPSLPNTYLPSYGLVNSTLRWILSQQVERLCNVPGRYLLLRYEDFMVAPDRELQRIFTMIGDPAEQRPQIMNHTISLNLVHSINGNPSRFRKGPVILQPDDEWRSWMSGFDRAVVNALAWPLLRHYGYELNGRPAAQGPGWAAK